MSDELTSDARGSDAPRSDSRQSAGANLGVLVPCRNEALTIERKLANLARATWPESREHHVLLVIDDGSTDGTAARAQGALERHTETFARSRVDVSVVANARAAGKAGAIQSGLELVRERVRLCVLTDADVVVDEGALAALQSAFASDPGLALACGAQRLVRDLAGDGSTRGADGNAPRDASTSYDRWTARVRRAESRLGVLFSVHGELLAWRTELGLSPASGIAADDLDLCFQVRERAEAPRRVRLVDSALFFEAKAAAGAAARAQSLRRAAAWFQVVRAHALPAQGALERVQWLFYRHVPGMAPRLTLVLPILSVLASALWAPRGVALAAALAWLLVFTSPIGWRWVRLMRVIAAARDLERAGSIGDRWETPRA